LPHRLAHEQENLHIVAILLDIPHRRDTNFARLHLAQPVDPPKLFAKTDVTADVDDVVGDVGSELKKMVRIIGQQRAPNMEIGLYCSDPYGAPRKIGGPLAGNSPSSTPVASFATMESLPRGQSTSFPDQ
jgi:hypothetical protein